jgi:hypothetical protein
LRLVERTKQLSGIKLLKSKSARLQFLLQETKQSKQYITNCKRFLSFSSSVPLEVLEAGRAPRRRTVRVRSRAVRKGTQRPYSANGRHGGCACAAMCACTLESSLRLCTLQSARVHSSLRVYTPVCACTLQSARVHSSLRLCTLRLCARVHSSLRARACDARPVPCARISAATDSGGTDSGASHICKPLIRQHVRTAPPAPNPALRHPAEL